MESKGKEFNALYWIGQNSNQQGEGIGEAARLTLRDRERRTLFRHFEASVVSPRMGWAQEEEVHVLRVRGLCPFVL